MKDSVTQLEIIQASYLKEKLHLKILTLDKDIIDSENVLTKWFSKHKIDFVIIRPDKYIYDAGRLYNLEKTTQHLQEQLEK